MAVLATGSLWLGGTSGAKAQVVVSSGGAGGGPGGGAGGTVTADGSNTVATTNASPGAEASGGGGGAPGFGQPGAGSSFGGLGGYGGANNTQDPSLSRGQSGNSVSTADEEFGYAGAGGGGAGGAGILSGTGSFGNQANVRGGDGGNGGSAFIGYGYGVGYGGNGGGGGAGILITGDAILTSNSAAVVGGYGGIGGNVSSGVPGTSGDGGAGIFIANGAAHPSSIFTNTASGTITGGTGGDAPYVFEAEQSGVAGNGGAGLVILGGGQFINSGSVSGGDGGAVFGSGFGGTGGIGVRAVGTNGSPAVIVNNASGAIYGGFGGNATNSESTPGDGGTGIAASNATIINRGYISGGSAGSGGYGGYGGGIGAGGVGIVGSNLTVRTSGPITGGQGTDGTPADAIQFTGGANTLILEPGFAFGGEVVVGRSQFRQLAVGPNAEANATGTLALGSSDTGVNPFNVELIGSLFQGFSSFQKIESGRWTLTGTNTDALSWQVFDGTLVVNGALPNSTFTVGDVPIDPVIGGGGTIGTLIVGNNGVVAPGIATPFTTLTVTGNATFNPGSTYQVQIGSAGQKDRIAVGGVTTIAPTNTSVSVIATPGAFAPFQQYVILTSAGGLAPGSRFSTVTSTNLAFLQPVLTYDANNVFLTLVGNNVTFPSVATTPNQQAAAGGIQSLGPGNPLYNIVLTQTASGAQQAFDATSGEPHASVATVGVGSAAFISTAIFDRLWNMGGAGQGDAFQMLQNFGSTLPTVLRCYTANDATSTTNLSSYSVWGQAFGSFGHNGGDGNATAIDNTLGGFIAGVDVPVYGYLADVWRFGVAGGYTNDSLSVPNRSSSGTYESAFGTLYGGMRAGAVDLRFGASLGTDSTELRRNVAFPGFVELERSNYGGTTVQGFAELGYRFAYGLNVLEPVAGFTAVHLHQDGFNEKGGIAALHGFGRDTDVETTTLGFRAEAVPFVEMPLVARVHLAWQHAYGDLSPTAVVAFRAGGAPFKVSGAPIDRDSALAEVGLEYRATSAMTIGLDYTGDVGPRDFANGVRGRLNYRF